MKKYLEPSVDLGVLFKTQFYVNNYRNVELIHSNFNSSTFHMELNCLQQTLVD